MDGLIPLVYKAIKKNKIRRQYEFLSSGAAQTQSYNVSVSDFYNITRHRRQTSGGELYMTKPSAETDNYNNNNNNIVMNAIAEAKLHRRHMSVEDLSAAVASGDSPPPKQLVRFGSHRMFSCVSGA